MKPAGAAADIPGLLRHDQEAKAKDREGFAGWKVRPESVQTRVVAGRQALSAVADYTEGNAVARVHFGAGQTAVFEAPAITLHSDEDGHTTVYTASPSSEPAEKMVEYMIWVRSPATQAFFFGRAKAADLAALQSGLDRLAATAVVP